MEWFANLKVGTRLIAGFIVVAAISAVVGGIGIGNMSRINDMADDLYAKELMGLSYIKEANINLIYIGRARANFLLATSAEERDLQKTRMGQYSDAVKQQMEKAKPLFVTAQAKEMFDTFARGWSEYEAEMNRSLSLAAAEKLQQRSDELTQSLAAVRTKADALDKMLTDLTKLKEERAKAASDETTALYTSSRTFMIVLIGAGVLLGIGLGLLIARTLTRQLGGEPNYAAETARRIAGGDLSLPVVIKDKDTTSLLAAMRSMQEQLSETVTGIKHSAESIATSSREIATGNADLSQRTEEQASSLEETASSMEELTSTVKQNTENARQANQLAAGASEVAIKGGTVVGQVVETMSSINESSKKIVDIISVIDGIAFQTNILALNAAVEAARAGEQGRGFAVVATEVRTLAQRSAAAAKEIKELISDSVGKVENGTQLVDQAGRTMEEIVAAVKRVTDVMAEITAASQEQSAGIEQINQAVTQMDEVTQQNAALVEEAAAAAASMEEQARTLTNAVAVFKLGSSGQRVSAAVRTEPVAAPQVERRGPDRAKNVQRLPAKRSSAAASAPAAKPAKTGTDGEWTEF